MDSPESDSRTVASRRSARRELALAFVLGAAAMAYIQSATYEPSGRDSFYHVKMAVLLPKIGFPERFHWLRHTILNERNVSHHHGFHIAMVPFVYASQWLADSVPQRFRDWAQRPGGGKNMEHFKIGVRSWLDSPYILGGKFLSVLLFGLAVVLCALILRDLDVPGRSFWLLCILALPTDFMLRMSYLRAPLASLVLLLLVFYCASTRRFVWVAVLGAVYCHVYGGFVFYPVIVGALILSYAVSHRDWRRCAALAVAAMAGSAIGLLSHPYFPENIAFLKVQLFETGLQTAGVGRVNVGSEWKPINLDYWLKISAFLLAVVVLSGWLRLSGARLREPRTLALTLLNLVFLLLCLRARRFIEYWPVFALLNAAALWRGFVSSWAAFRESLPEAAADMVRRVAQRSYVLLCLVTVVAAAATLVQARKAAASRFDVRAIQRAMTYLKENTPERSLVFADDWDEFPLYFYYNHHNDYVCGLDPQFTNSRDPVLWERFCVITQGRAPRVSRIEVSESSHGNRDPRLRQGEVSIDISDIATHFEADYVLVDHHHQPFYRQLLQHPELFEYRYPQTLGDAPPASVDSLAIFAVRKQ